MSKRLWRLMLTQINVGFGLSQSRYYYLRKRERLWEAALILFSLLLLAASLGFGIFKFASAYYAAYARFGQGDATLLLGVLLCQLVTLVLGFALVVGNFYYANDLSVLIPLPFRPWEVLAGKLALLLAGEYAMQAVFFLPVLLAFGIEARVSPVPYGLAALIVFLALPVIPLTLAAIPAILLMRVLGGTRRRDTLLVVAGFLFTILIVAGQFYFQGRLLGPGGSTSELLQRILGTAHGLADLLGRLSPPAAWAARALADPYHGLLYLLFFLLSSALGLAAFLYLGEAIFYEGALRGTEAGRRAGHVGGDALSARKLRSRSPVVSLARAEARRFVRTPIYVLNGFVGFILFPVLFLLPTALRSSPDLAKMFAAIRSIPGAGSMGALAIAAYYALLTTISTIPFTPFSREGRRNIWILKALPVAGSAVVEAKIRGALLMILPGGLPGAVALEWVFRFPAAGFAAGLVLGALTSCLICCVGVCLDLARPMLDWISQEKAIKSNLNTMLGLVIGFGAIAVAALGVAGLIRLGLPAHVVAAIAGVILAALAILTAGILPGAAGRLWGRLEV